MTFDTKIVRCMIALCSGLALGACTFGNASTKASLAPAAVAPPSALAFSTSEVLRDKLSNRAKSALSAAEAQALNYGQPGQTIDWKSTRNDASGSVVAYQPFRVGDSNCRRFVHNVNAGADKLETSGTACRHSDAVWTLVQ
ncbi:hypothetical protein ACFQ14_05485 [Pseudahrensia aquimaris]|uniref:Surface antigen n=1 Tax=Pseudahrensia aquimaris TaxID=744461 RepID=A0ABW3FDQ6_9HYPH